MADPLLGDGVDRVVGMVASALMEYANGISVSRRAGCEALLLARELLRDGALPRASERENELVSRALRPYMDELAAATDSGALHDLALLRTVARSVEERLRPKA